LYSISSDHTRFDAAIVDLDGTTIDTLGDFAQALNRMLDDLALPRVAPAAIAAAIVRALKDGIEDVYVGDVAQEFRARLAENPKGLERELGAGG